MVTHEEEVEIIGNILNKLTDWSFAIHIFLRELTFKDPVSNFDSYRSKLDENRFIVNSIFGGYEYLDLDKQLSGTPLEDIGLAAKINLGKIEYYEAISKSKTTIGKLLVTSAYLAWKISNKSSERSYLFDGYFIYRNYYKQYQIEISRSEIKLISNTLLSCGEGFRSSKNIFVSNCLQREYKSKENFLCYFGRLSKSIHAFHFYSPRLLIPHCIEEADLKSMLLIAVGEDYKIIPLKSSKDGINIPDVNKWSRTYIDELSIFFNDERIRYCLDIISLLKFGEMPSEKAQFTLLSIFKRTIQLRKIYESSVIEILGCLWSEGKLIKEVKDKYRCEVLPIIDRTHSILLLQKLIRNQIFIGDKAMKKVNSFEKKKLSLLSSTITGSSLIDILSDEDILRFINVKQFKAISNSFFEYIGKVSDNLTPSLYISYSHFLSSLPHTIISDDALSSERMRLWKTWKNHGYSSYIPNLQKISFTIKENANDIQIWNNHIVSDSRNFGFLVFAHSKDSLVKYLKSWSEHVFLKLCQKVIIAKDFPYLSDIQNDSILPKFLANEFEFALKGNDYMMLNTFKSEQYLKDYYDESNKNARLFLSIFNQEEKLYNRIKKIRPQYHLEPWINKPTYAWICQLFPALENEILDYGSLNGIIPLQEESDGTLRKRKEPSAIFKKLFGKAIDEFGTLESVSDLVCVYQMMYDQYGENIRNSLIHGDDYPQSKSELMVARKETIIALATMVDRVEKEKA